MNKALLVGINAYPGAPLRGCVNDITDMAHLLVNKFGFKTEEIRLLTDARATTAAILERLEWLVQSKPGDRIVFHYSGHGAQVPDRNNDGELDKLYEVVCPVDFDWSASRMITDKKFVQVFSRIPAGVKFAWISDSCHSGDLDRGIPKKVKKSKFLGGRAFPIPADIAWRHRVAKEKKMQSRGMVNGKLDVGYVSGCQSNQTSADASFGNRPNGALTYFLIRNLMKSVGAPLNQVVSGVTKDLTSYGYSQRPTCSGARAGLPFLG